ncbi:DUF4124 domain-containing protein [Flagellatimonas centrodinii]|uniref:DUF4124 domain-containing protein n=1 Tax=Flagellatimonas centrodinii TaxID=2806210 RepID=UPI001FEF73BB|nr:DUF4124 domain-containing protein [Flagellatimonas centrodinii]ULQ47425.1 DUF4124 domain-containing protein [Flagellatimonas centrodinii]
MKIGVLVVTAMACWSTSGLAQSIYKCSQPDGRISFQDKPCAAAADQSRVQRAPTTAPDFTAWARYEEFNERAESARRAEAARASEAHRNAMQIEAESRAAKLPPPAPPKVRRRLSAPLPQHQNPTFVDPYTNTIYNRVPGGGAINAQTGQFFPGAPGGPIIDPKTALPVPGQ